ncbi:MAG: MFS transporter [Rickettsiales bacterium]|nr:MAG: MFS transporter [Rickettsiales bacterium]
MAQNTTKKRDKDHVSTKVIIAYFAMVVGMFMAILDVQIVASSLSVIAAGLSASRDELSWIQTSYLIAEVIVIPITGFITKAFSTRIIYLGATIGFTIMSVLCSLAWNIESMIFFRVMQGMFGGAMIPITFGLAFVIFPKNIQVTVSMIIGLVVTIAPTIGPTLGGYITEISSWHFIFLINIIPGILVSIAVFLYVDFDKPNYTLLKNFDFLGIVLIAITLGGLQYVLEEGNKKGWMEDNHLLFLSIVVAISFVWTLIQELTHKNPIVDFSAFQDRNFSLSCVFSFILGLGIYVVIYLLPLFLFTVAGYSSLQIGIAMMVAGAFQFLSAPIAARMLSVGTDERIVLAIGFVMFAMGCYTNTFLTAESRYWELFIPQALRGFSVMFCFISINGLAFDTMPKSRVQNASGLYNLTRNLGGAIGLASINNLVISRTKIYAQAIKDNMPMTSPQLQETVGAISESMAGRINDPELAGLIFLDSLVTREAFIIAINDAFAIIGLLFCSGLLLLPFLVLTKKGANSNVH